LIGEHGLGKGNGMKVVLAHGPAGLFDLFPLLFVGAGVWVILKVLREGQHKTTSTRTLPTNPWSRQVHSATRRRGTDKSTGPSSERPGRRFGAPRLQVMAGDAAGENRPAVPRRFEPPPPGRRKTG
jgi:hypothetical protein